MPLDVDVLHIQSWLLSRVVSNGPDIMRSMRSCFILRDAAAASGNLLSEEGIFLVLAVPSSRTSIQTSTMTKPRPRVGPSARAQRSRGASASSSGGLCACRGENTHLNTALRPRWSRLKGHGGVRGGGAQLSGTVNTRCITLRSLAEL